MFLLFLFLELTQVLSIIPQRLHKCVAILLRKIVLLHKTRQRVVHINKNQTRKRKREKMGWIFFLSQKKFFESKVLKIECACMHVDNSMSCNVWTSSQPQWKTSLHIFITLSLSTFMIIIASVIFLQPNKPQSQQTDSFLCATGCGSGMADFCGKKNSTKNAYEFHSLYTSLSLKIHPCICIHSQQMLFHSYC